MEVRRNDDAGRYALGDDGRVVAIADFTVDGDRVIFPHTEVDPELRGHGLGAVLVKAALDDVRPSGRSIVPRCWFVAQFVQSHQEYADLLAA
jgi:predicted GNAT family acetyltransferase